MNLASVIATRATFESLRGTRFVIDIDVDEANDWQGVENQWAVGPRVPSHQARGRGS
jgi:hypothetical protein